jgi:hypothetical protein
MLSNGQANCLQVKLLFVRLDCLLLVKSKAPPQKKSADDVRPPAGMAAATKTHSSSSFFFLETYINISAAGRYIMYISSFH